MCTSQPLRTQRTLRPYPAPPTENVSVFRARRKGQTDKVFCNVRRTKVMGSGAGRLLLGRGNYMCLFMYYLEAVVPPQTVVGLDLRC